jgi:NAD+ synthase
MSLRHGYAKIEGALEHEVQSMLLDPADAVCRIGDAMRHQLAEVLRRRGVVIGISGGVDSAVCAGLAVRALGAKRVFGLFMPERDSDAESLRLASLWADQLGIAHATEDISATLEACGCYRRRDAAVRRLVPEYGDGWRCKLVLTARPLDSDRLNVFHLVVQPPAGATREVRLPPKEYREIVAATNFKQRVRKMFEYYHADRKHFAVVGTPNRLEYDQGFFVKGGDGLADIKPIAHLYKAQVYALAEYLGVPAEITGRPSTTDTYSLAQSQEEFFFSMPMDVVDRVLLAYNTGEEPDQTASRLGYEPEQIERAFRDLERKRSTTQYLHQPPLLVEPVSEIGSRPTALP